MSPFNALRYRYFSGLGRLRQLAPPEAELARGKADYERTALNRLVASGNVRSASPKGADKARQRAQERIRFLA